jgi:drug/metabolite transporter (DMT)-like permease
MIAILGGLGAALSWAIATLVSSRSSRMIGPMSVLGWVMVVGLVVAIVPALLAGPVDLGTPELAGLVVVGLSHNFGLLLAYKALSIGRVSIVAPIVATEGALAAVLSVVFGEPLTGAMAFLLGAISVGVVLAAVERSADPATPSAAAPEATRRAALFAVAAALTFSVGLLVAGRLGQEGMPPAWVMLASRTIGVLIIALPLVLTRRFRLTRAAAPLVAVAGVLEVFGGAIYVVAASAPGGVAVAAVLSSQFAAIAAVVAFFLFRERLQRIQVIGVAIIAIGITVLAAIQS